MTLLTAPIASSCTPEDVLSMPENKSLELVNGRIVEKNVSIDSSDAEGEIYFQIRKFLKSQPVAKVFPATLGYTCQARTDQRVPLIRADHGKVLWTTG